MVVNKTQPKASEEMGLAESLKSVSEVFHAAAYNTGGKNSRKTTSESRETMGRPGTNPIPMPANTSITG
jgi:hypothetical protein